MSRLPLIVDSHVHFWDDSQVAVPWLRAVPALQRAFVPADYQATAPAAVAEVIFVEANCAPGQHRREVEWVEGLAAAGAPIVGIVAFVDVSDQQQLATDLAWLMQRPLVRGVRQNIQGQPAGFATSLRSGLRQVAAA
ncbi:MAG: amidohydrolase family protein, partial [Planctomycetota bacterium]